MLASSPFDQIQRRTISEQVADQILALISSGQLRPGDRLPAERELAEQLGVGRTSIREALRHLSMLGLLEAKQGCGTHVSHDVRSRVFELIGWSLYLNADEVEDLFAVRRALEVLASQLAALNAAPEELEKLKVYRDLLELEGRDIVRETETDVAFHQAITQASHNVFLIQLMVSIQTLMRRYIQRSTQMRASALASYNEHHAIYEAIAAGDSTGAGNAMIQHLAIAHQSIKAQLEQTH